MEESPFLLETDDPQVQNLIQDYEPLGTPPAPAPTPVQMAPNDQSGPSAVDPTDFVNFLDLPSIVRPARSASCPPDQDAFISTVFAGDGVSNG